MKSPLGTLAKMAAKSSAAADPPVPYARTGGATFSTMQTGGSDPAGYMRTYGANGTVYSIVSMLARQTAKKNWHLYRQAPQDGRRRYTTGDKGSDQRVEVIKHQAIALWNKPNRWTTGFQFRELGQTYLDLTGEDYIVIGRDPRSTLPLSLWQVRPDRMDPVPSRDEYLLGYVYTGPTGEQIPLQIDEVIQNKYPNPFDPYHGLGPIQSILVDIDAAKYSAQWNRNFFLNSATPGGVIQVDKRLSDEEWNEFTNRWRETHRGVGAAHRVAVLEQGAVWVPNAHSMRDMDFAGLRGVSRDVIREAFAMHKAILGTADDVNRANAVTAQEHFESFLIADRLDRWRDVLNCFYLPLFGTAGEGVELDHDDPVTSNREADALELKSKAEAVQRFVDAGYDPHDALEVVGLPDMKVVEKATQQPALLPGWTAPGAPGEPTPGEPGEGDSDGSGEGGAAQNRRLPAITVRSPRNASKKAPDHNLDDVDKQWKAAVAILVAAYIAQVIAGQIAQLIAQIRRLVDDGDTEGLADMDVDSDEGKQLILTSMTAMAAKAAKQAAAEAKAQGADVDPQTVDADVLAATAAAIAAVQAAALALSAATEATRLAGDGADGEDVAAAVEEFLNGLSDAALTGRLAGALSIAQNEARIATFIKGGPSADLFASEMNDRNTCGPCKSIDGEYIGNTRNENIVDAVDALYPNGGYIDCAGGDRCRGTVIAAYAADDSGPGGNPDEGDLTGQLPFFLVDLARHVPAAANGHSHAKAGAR